MLSLASSDHATLFQVNIDLSQFLYHEVFGKLPNDHHPPGNHLPLHPNLMPHPPPPHGPPLHHHPAPLVPGSATTSASGHDGMAAIMSLAGNNGQMGPPGSAGQQQGPGQQPPGHGHPPPPSSVNLDQKPDPAMMVPPPPGTELGEIKYNAGGGGDMESHNCEVCGKSFQFRYQLIVHRRYHVERKPFTCQVSLIRS